MKARYPPPRSNQWDLGVAPLDGATSAVAPVGPWTCVMFRLFERLLNPTDTPEQAEPPPGFVAFFWHFARQAKGLFVGAVRGRLRGRAARFDHPGLHGPHRHADHVEPAATSCSRDYWPHLVGMALVLLVARPLAMIAQNLIANQAIAANVSNRIRWQNHWYVVRQSWTFFQNDFAGRIANRVMQTGPAIRETLVALLTSVWYILVYGTARADPARVRRSVARAADRAVVRRLPRAAARARAAHARPLEGGVGRRARC